MLNNIFFSFEGLDIAQMEAGILENFFFFFFYSKHILVHIILEALILVCLKEKKCILE